MKNIPRVSDNRHLAVVMFLDMVGYSARMASEEANALACVSDLEGLLRKRVPAFGGRLVKFMGDGSMSYFPTASQAVSCALKILELIRSRNRRFPPRQQFKVRIGLHLGDVVFEKGDLFGDAVNVAARVQPWADPGSLAMTGIVYSQVRNKIRLPGLFLNRVRLKNIQEEIPIFSVLPPEKNLFLWKLSKRPRILETAMVLLILSSMGGGLGYLKNRTEPQQWALMGVAGPADDLGQKTAETLRQRMEMDFSAWPDIQWMKRETALALFRQAGISTPSPAVDRLDLAACHAAWKGGLRYLMVLRLDPLPQNRWKLDAKIIHSRGRVVVADFAAEGSGIPELAGTLRRETRRWIEKKIGDPQI